ncbi:sulfite exporter TauE/SafE family protein [Metallumcola ferriviriculae]|uniref:Probable membrane transporter protein n=1 Tax=Metallumcola ferriviriculae TaxID=3039180 RepID=A0AAU0UNG6_9FIRM|nr:sulfite exporter TauE/SafE family protein [Desulfitibacteraceae bacterium MK1]
MHFTAIILLGLLAGVLSSLLGIGGGIVLVPGMIYLLGLPVDKAVGTSLAIILPTALVGVYRHTTYGNVDWKAGLLIIVGSVTGAWLGAWLSRLIPAEILKKLFAGLIVLVAIKMWRG